jgi:hypothetical protein
MNFWLAFSPGLFISIGILIGGWQTRRAWIQSDRRLGICQHEGEP